MHWNCAYGEGWRKLIGWTGKLVWKCKRCQGDKQSIVKTIVRRKMNWIGHVMKGEGLLMEEMEGRMEGRNRMRMLKK